MSTLLNRSLVVCVSGAVALSLSFGISSAKAPLKPKIAECESWLLMSPPKANWLNAPDKQWWLCIAGPLAGASVGGGSSCVSNCGNDIDYPGNSDLHRRDFEHANPRGIANKLRAWGYNPGDYGY